MSKPIIILADSDDKYLVALELKFIEELYEKIELEVITDQSYFNEYFSSPKKAEILVVSEGLYASDLQKHNINYIFVLSESPKKNETDDLAINKIYKYTSIKEIFNEIMYTSSRELLSGDIANKETQIVMVYSAGGGSGKTTIALGLSACFTTNHKRAIYIDAEYIHNFQNYLTSKAFITNEAYREFIDKNEQVYRNIKHHLRKEQFDYLPPFCASLSSLNISFSFYKNLINAVKATKDYDFIVVDTDIIFDDQKAALMSVADKVLIIVNQDVYSTFKTNVLLNNINCSDNEKYLFICNKFNDNAPNTFLSGDSKSKIVISEYVEYVDDCEIFSIDQLTAIDGLQKIAYMLI